VGGMSGCGDPPSRATGSRGGPEVFTVELDSPLTLIGDVPSKPGHQLYRVRSVFRTPDGRVVVANGGSGQIRVFDSSGALMSEMGGSGGGPKEFGALVLVWPMAGDSVGAYDPIGNRVSAWDLDGHHGRTVAVPVPRSPLVEGRFADGSLLVVSPPAPSRTAQAWDPYVGFADVFRVWHWQGRSEPLGRFSFAESLVATPPGSERRVHTRPPAAAVGVFAPRGDGFVHGFGDAWRLVIHDGRGVPRDTVVIDRERRRRPASAARRWLDAALEAAPESMRPQLRPYYARFPQPEFYPTFDRLVVAGSGDLWVRDHVAAVDSVARWTVLNASGRVGTATLPRVFEPMQIGDDWLVGVDRTETDMELVVVYSYR
jgi:hypothetical protein